MREEFLNRQLVEKREKAAWRSLRISGLQSDFYSNDYLGIIRNSLLEKELSGKNLAYGSGGSRLLAGNYALIEEVENQITRFHEADSALIFNSGYDANFGLLSCIARRGDLILFDKLSHASIRDGIRQSFADGVSFLHNDLEDLENKLKARKGNCFVVTESVFSMDGDMAPLEEMVRICENYGTNLVVDEAHATGVIGLKGEGLLQHLGLHHRCFARVHTFGKALGCHGAVILGSPVLREYLINFCRPFIYSTSLPPVSVAAIQETYRLFPGMVKERETIKKLISLFQQEPFKKSTTPVQCFISPGNENAKGLADELLKHNLDARAILYPTVPLGEERLRITLHSFNSEEDTQKLIRILTKRLTVDG